MASASSSFAERSQEKPSEFKNSNARSQDYIPVTGHAPSVAAQRLPGRAPRPRAPTGAEAEHKKLQRQSDGIPLTSISGNVNLSSRGENVPVKTSRDQNIAGGQKRGGGELTCYRHAAWNGREFASAPVVYLSTG